MPIMTLDYGKPNPFSAVVGKTRNLAWPVDVYRVTLPQPLKDGEHVNAFERVVLKLIDAGGLSESEVLASETCLPDDLVRCILLRLEDQAYIDEYRQIIRRQRDEWVNMEQGQGSFVTALLFREVASGKILPTVHFLNDENPLRKKEVDNRLITLIDYDRVHTNCHPTPRDVISALRGMQKRSKAFGNTFFTPSVQQITIAEDAELNYLDCPIAIQKSDGEFRIADPFGSGFSLVLEGAFCRLLENTPSLADWMMKWKRNLYSKGPLKQAIARLEPYDNDDNWARYPKLIKNLNAHVKWGRQHRFIEQIHAAIEWALFYSCAQRPYSPAVDRLKLEKHSEHPDLLLKAAEDLSLMLPPGGLYPVREGKLDDFRDGKAEFGTVLSLSLVMAVGDALHPLRRIAYTHQDFIIRLFEIKNRRDALAHGEGKKSYKDIELSEEVFMREVVSTLLPSIRFSDTPVVEVDEEAVADFLLDARTSIQSEFGFARFSRLGANLQDRLIATERFWLMCNNGDDALAFVCDIYSILQGSFRKTLAGALPPEISTSRLMDEVQNRAVRSNLGDLPEWLRTVREDAIRSTLEGNDTTLGSCVAAFLLISDDVTLRAVADTRPLFLSDIGSVVRRRGHGNEPLNLTREEIREMRIIAYSTIKLLLEV